MRGVWPGTGWEKFFWLLFQKTTKPVAVLDEERRIVEVDDASLDLFGRSRGDLIGTSVVDMIEHSERAESAAAWNQFLHTGDYDVKRTFVRRSSGAVCPRCSRSRRSTDPRPNEPLPMDIAVERGHDDLT